jgi:hypothetical protein
MFVTFVFITFVVSYKYNLLFIACFLLLYVAVCYSSSIKTTHNDKYCVEIMFLNCSFLCVHSISLLMICNFQQCIRVLTFTCCMVFLFTLLCGHVIIKL